MRTTKIIVWSVIALLIIGLFAFLFINPDYLSERLPSMDFSINISDWDSVHVFNWGSYSYKDASLYTAGAGEVNAGEVKKLDLGWLSGAIRVVPSDGGTVAFSEECDRELEEKEELRWYLDKTGTLHIRFCAPGKITWPLQKTLTLTVPSSVYFREIEVDTASADFTAEGLKASDFSVDTASGNVKLTDCACEKMDVDTASGDLQLTRVSGKRLNVDTASGTMELEEADFREVEADSASGDMRLGFATCPAGLDLDTASGDVLIAVKDAPGFTLDFDTASGDFESDYPCKYTAKHYVYGTGECDWKVDTASGDCRITDHLK